ncbi:NnrU family protein [uncultured Cohaesibacter sp.]|uniref:NnrU family protein n=1 Tax=uncultured Cohaesibacter sp. TaxID=1002546 RepID=UPI002930BF48|nr:NnrU family protein [uncultured Cohaesibacter sp.]
MTMLIVGVLLWFLVHVFPIFLPQKRKELIARMGEGPYKGAFTLLIVLSLVLIVFGWRSAGEAGYVGDLYSEDWTRHANYTLLLFSMILFGAAKAPSRIRRVVRHPMLWGMALWAIGHLLVNNDPRSLVLFGGMLVWSFISMWGSSRRDGPYTPPAVKPLFIEFNIILMSVVIYCLIIWLHPYFTGMDAVDLGALWDRL